MELVEAFWSNPVGAVFGIGLAAMIAGLCIRLLAGFQPSFGSVVGAVLAASLICDLMIFGLRQLKLGLEPIAAFLLAACAALVIHALAFMWFVRGAGGEKLSATRALGATALEMVLVGSVVLAAVYLDVVGL